MKGMNHTEKIYSFSYLRAIACIAIIVLHMFASASIIYGEQSGILVNACSRSLSNVMMWAVPCFVMISGALLLMKERKLTYRKLFQKYVLRMFLVLIIFSFGFRLFDMVMDNEQISVNILLSWLQELFTGTGWSHLWYIYLLIGLYLMLPFYKKIADYGSKMDIKYLLLVYLIFISLLPLTRIWNFSSGFYIHVSTIYPFYFFCGYAVHEGIIKINRWFALFLSILSSCLIVILTILRWENGFEWMEQFWNYSSILVITQSVSIFALCDQFKEKAKGIISKILLEIDKYSFGIYLIHMVFIRLILRYMKFNPYSGNIVLNFVLLIGGTFLISYGCTKILKMIPGLKRIL